MVEAFTADESLPVCYSCRIKSLGQMAARAEVCNRSLVSMDLVCCFLGSHFVWVFSLMLLIFRAVDRVALSASIQWAYGLGCAFTGL